MATEKILNTRIQLKYDTWSNWSNNTVAGKGGNLILKKGELGICEIPASTNAGQSTSEPVILFKVGTYDGVNENTKTAFKDLPWISALAADVHAWAKKPTLDANDLPTIPVAKLPEIPGDKLGITVTVTGSGNAITNSSWDANTKTLTLTKGENFLKASEFHDTTYSAGTKLNLDGTTFNHETTTRTDTSDASSAEFGKTIEVIDSVTSDETGHITAVNKKTITLPTPEEVSLPTVEDTAVNGEFVTEVDQNAGAISVTRKSVDVVYDEDGFIKLTIDGTPIGTGFDAAAFVKDSYLSSAVYDDETNILTLTFIDNEDKLQAIPVDLSDLVDVYSADEVSLTKDGSTFKIKNGGVGTAQIANNAVGTAQIADSAVGTAQIADKAVTKAKLEESVQASLDKADSALQSHQDISGKADKVTSATNGNFAGLDASGNLTDSGSKASDFATAAQGGKADTAIQEVTSAAGNGIKATTKDNIVTIDWDSEVTLVFDCGTSTVNV